MKTILLLTFDISPYRGSESSVGWNYIVNMSKDNRLIVLYADTYKSEIEDYLQKTKLDNVQFHDIAYTEIIGKGIIFEIKYYLNYKRWHKKAYEKALDIINNQPIDVIHYLNPIGFKEPGYLWKLNKPYIWGPITAVHNRPLPLYKVLSRPEKVKALIRRLVHNALFRFSPNFKKVLNRCDVIGAATPRTKEMLQSIHGKIAFYLPENGIMHIENTIPIKYAPNQKLSLIWVGRLDYFKAPILLLDALRLIEPNKLKTIEVHFVGDGHLRNSLEEYVLKHKLDKSVIWHGQVSRNEVQQIFKLSHLHVITSLGEATTTVIWEAMSKGIPTLTLDHCGMSGVICKKCGIKIPIKSYAQVIRDIANNISLLIDNPQQIERLSSGTIACAVN